ncbi:PRC-barrel domain-containing protein [Schlegelella sp. S2-27]|uniref:PRC-barrel domain-containing protein n=1 Tax=Caldimonas mangrovi TaxID=2944811 RepID=A0ABT0YR73_9BURK|nr:PRC-barrel domain-containing protein [Caldimonas mangrovi]MCM5681248.1 PRC-barrel domain-containing protein [Caldimonas mangrovi]
MLHKVTQWRGAAVTARDGDVGSIDDVYFDDERLTVRYLVVDTGGWLNHRRVLISPYAVRTDVSADEQVFVDLTRAQVENSPPIEADEPVSRLYEKAYADYYRYPYYWAGPFTWGPGAYPALTAGTLPDALPAANDPPAIDDEVTQQVLEAARRSHLRSSRELIGYHAEARDGSAGRINDLVIDDVDWSVQQIVVDTRKWLPGGQVTVPADAVSDIDWAASEVRLNMDRRSIKQAPAAH